MTEKHVMPLTVPVVFETPAEMVDSVREVLAGEYESGFSGEDLSILDIGANVGSFSLWAHCRWPGSRITAYEPHPGTFAMLQSNLQRLSAFSAVNAAVYPSQRKSISFFSRYPGDGEAGVAECMERTFAPAQEGERFDVAVVHPKNLPAADVVKLDVEGAEADILANMDLSGVSLILLEYQNDANRAAIKALLEPGFEIVREDEFTWDSLLRGSGYRRDLSGDNWGHLFLVARSQSKLRFVPPPPHKQRGPLHRLANRIAARIP
jgi:FkbM family methyltransferase